MKFRNPKTGHVVDRFIDMNCELYECESCPINNISQNNGYHSCTEYVDKTENLIHAASILGYYPVIKTFRERLEREHPECIYINGCGVSGCKGCPEDYGYEKQEPVGCSDMTCVECWNRIIPIEETEEKKMGEQEIKDSGERREFETGAVRDIQEGCGRCDLLPLDVSSCILEDHILEQINCFKHCSDTSFLVDAIKWACNGSVFENVPEALLEVSKHFEKGVKKYGENNWQKGIPVHCYIDSAVRHYLKYCAGRKDEPHDRAFVWNLMCCIWTMEHMPELDDYTEGKKDE